jgi:hypothetical protein
MNTWALCSETSGINNLTTQLYTPEYLNIQQHCCDNLKCPDVFFFITDQYLITDVIKMKCLCVR